ncbi:MAG: ATP-binding protein, partial [Candidatus Margulisbacteria bacterium]|nr:ATP-binding protein [Candidatus Margulisiibacteriota bacterium]
FKDRALYIDFEDERLGDFKQDDFQILQDAFWDLHPELTKKEAIYLLDEVQNVKGWEKFARRVAEKEKSKVFVSGSSSKIMPQQLHTALRGRSWSVAIFPFSFIEFLKTKEFNLEKLAFRRKDQSKILFFLKDYLLWGGFPETCFISQKLEKQKVISEYLDAIFFKDLVERYQITNIPLLEALRNKLFCSFAQKLSLTAIYKQLKDKLPFSKDSLFAYFKYFLESMVVFEVKKFSESLYQRLRNPAKIYLVDTGLARKTTSDDLGRRLENLVFLQLQRSGLTSYYYEGKNECDFIVKTSGGKFSAMQVTWDLTPENEKRELDGLVEAAQHLNAKTGTLITFDQEDCFSRKGVKIAVVPAWKWLLEKNQQK